MSWLVLRLGKRPADADLAFSQQEARQRARAAEPPPACTGTTHAQTVARAYRQGEPACDWMDEFAFDELAAARDWRDELVSAGREGERVMLTQLVPVAQGERGVLRHVELLRRRQDFDHAAFLAYWREVHGPIAAAIPHVLRYEQCPVADPDCPFDGVAMLWFPSIDAMREGARHPAFLAARADMARFMDMEASRSLLMQELALA